MNQAADFSLQDQNDKTHKLADYRGSWLVLYFYPKDDTPGCTTEACSFRDDYSEISKYAKLVGISKDSVASHAKFAQKYDLNFPILSDPDHKTIEAYSSWTPKKFMGKDYLGTERNTFIINPDGMIAKEYRGVTPKGHSQQIIADLESLQN